MVLMFVEMILFFVRINFFLILVKLFVIFVVILKFGTPQSRLELDRFAWSEGCFKFGLSESASGFF